MKLFQGMRAGAFEEGAHVLRAKIDMASPNITMRDPVMVRIKKESHYRTGDQWCIYPMYDFAHCLSDSIEKITLSICTLEFENNRPLYDWFLDELKVDDHPQQIEFARLNLSYTVLSKRRLIELVEKDKVRGWDDPRMPTLAGMRRGGYTPEAIRQFCEGNYGKEAGTHVYDYLRILRDAYAGSLHVPSAVRWSGWTPTLRLKLLPATQPERHPSSQRERQSQAQPTPTPRFSPNLNPQVSPKFSWRFRPEITIGLSRAFTPGTDSVQW